MTPPIHEQAWSAAKALASFVADGCRTVTPEQYQARLEICEGCKYRRRNRCRVCGCYLSVKAKLRTETCPMDKWEE